MPVNVPFGGVLSPFSFEPQHSTVPSALIAQL
jgi:hypothetical protein